MALLLLVNVLADATALLSAAVALFATEDQAYTELPETFYRTHTRDVGPRLHTSWTFVPRV